MYPLLAPINDWSIWFWRSHLRMIRNMNICYQEPGKNTLQCFLCRWYLSIPSCSMPMWPGLSGNRTLPVRDLIFLNQKWLNSDSSWCRSHQSYCIRIGVSANEGTIKKMMLSWIKSVARPKTEVQTPKRGDFFGSVSWPKGDRPHIQFPPHQGVPVQWAEPGDPKPPLSLYSYKFGQDNQSNTTARHELKKATPRGAGCGISSEWLRKYGNVVMVHVLVAKQQIAVKIM